MNDQTDSVLAGVPHDDPAPRNDPAPGENDDGLLERVKILERAGLVLLDRVKILEIRLADVVALQSLREAATLSGQEKSDAGRLESLCNNIHHVWAEMAEMVDATKEVITGENVTSETDATVAALLLRVNPLVAQLINTVKQLTLDEQSGISIREASDIIEEWATLRELRLTNIEMLRRMFVFFRTSIMVLPFIETPDYKPGAPFSEDDVGVRTIRDFCEIARRTGEALADMQELRTYLAPYLKGKGDQASLERAGLTSYLRDLDVVLSQAAFSIGVAGEVAQRFVAIEPGSTRGGTAITVVRGPNPEATSDSFFSLPDGDSASNAAAMLERHHQLAAEIRDMLHNGGAGPNVSQLQRCDAMLREIAGLPLEPPNP